MILPTIRRIDNVVVRSSLLTTFPKNRMIIHSTITSTSSSSSSSSLHFNPKPNRSFVQQQLQQQLPISLFYKKRWSILYNNPSITNCKQKRTTTTTSSSSSSSSSSNSSNSTTTVVATTTQLLPVVVSETTTITPTVSILNLFLHRIPRFLLGIIVVVTGISFTIGFTLGQQYNSKNNSNHHNKNHLPNGLPRTCCDNTTTTTTNNNQGTDDDDKEKNSSKHDDDDDSSVATPTTTTTTTTEVDDVKMKIALLIEKQQFIQRLNRILGKENVIVVNNENNNNNNNNTKTAPYLKGARIIHSTNNNNNEPNNDHHTVIIVTPQQLHHVVSLVEACIQFNTISYQQQKIDRSTGSSSSSPPKTTTTTENNTTENRNHHHHHPTPSSSSSYYTTITIIPQGQNTGLTGGSTPRYHHHHHHNNHHRITIVLSMKNCNAIFPIDNGLRVCCMAGVGLGSLEQFLQEYFPDRESHSILGSTFLNPTTAAGVALGSGGTQCRKGPAYTERALYIKITENKWHEQQIDIINTLDIDGFNDIDLPIGSRRKQMDTIPYRIDTWGRWIAQGYERDMKYTTAEVLDQMKKDDGGGSSSSSSSNVSYPLASDVHYGTKLCRRNSTSVSRYNADCSGPDCCRSEGKVILLATVHDTFPKPKAKKTYWISFDSIETALAFRQQVALDNPTDLPISMEYMDRDAFDVVNEAGRVLGNVIKYIGTSSPLIRQLWNIKLYIEALPYDTAPLWIDQLLFHVNKYFPALLPPAIMDIGHEWDHHVMLTIGDFGNGTMDRLTERMNHFAQTNGSKKINIIECDVDKGKNTTLSNATATTAAAISAFRFVAAPAFRTWCVGKKLHGYSVDYALPKNGGSVPPLYPTNHVVNDDVTTPLFTSDVLPSKIPVPVKRMRYSHFACNVVHEDLAYTPDVDIEHAKHVLKDVIELECCGKLPAEHGHGTEYIAPTATQERWKRMDPLNLLNPGIGGLSCNFRYEEKDVSQNSHPK